MLIKSDEYDDIINLPHHISTTRKRMTNYERAAQFAPFAALTGHDDAIKETARLTEEFKELTEEEKANLNGKLQFILELETPPEVTITFFIPDKRKSGGEYSYLTGSIKRFDEYEKAIVMTDKTEIPIDFVYDIECILFKDNFD